MSSAVPPTGSSAPDGAAPSAERRGWALRDRPGVLWLVLAVLVALVHPFVPSARWLMVHLVLLGALTHSVMVWSTHFTQALLKTPPGLDDRMQQSRRLVALLVGTALVLVGVPTTWWWVTLAGAVLVFAAVTMHAVQLVRRLRAALPGRFRITVRYYVAAASFLALGAGLGATLARGLDEQWHGRVLLAHTMANLLGWVGLTVTGTLVTLWPTMLRTRIGPRAERTAAFTLPALVCSVLLVQSGALTGLRPLAVAGLLAYLVSLLVWASAVLTPVRRRAPREFAPASVGAGLVWWVVGLVMLTIHVATSPSWGELPDGFGWVTSALVAGFALQLLTGALSYLVPSVIGGGKTVVRAGQAWLDRWGTARLATINLGLLVCLLPVPSVTRVVASSLVLLALAAFVPLMLRGVHAAARARREVMAARAAGERPSAASAPVGTPDHLPSVWSGGQLIAAVSAVLLAVALGVAVDPTSAGLQQASDSSGGVAATGRTRTVDVVAKDMHFQPSSVTVAAGDRVVIRLRNEDPTNVHDLAIGGKKSPRLSRGKSTTLDLGVVGRTLNGWCTVIGHRQMGMVFDVKVAGAPAGPVAAPPSPSPSVSHHGSHGTSGTHGGHSPVGATVSRPVNPVLGPVPQGTVHRVTLRAQEIPLEVAPGVTRTRWTFGDGVPGPTLHGKVGDTFVVTLVNDGTMGHSIDFHAGALAPDKPMRTIAPGQTLVYTFKATRAGIWMYHCSTMPMSTHIASGMHGAVVIEPRGGLPKVDRSYVLVQSEVYRDPADTTAQPEYLVFNGIANQYDQHQPTVKVGQRVRFWVLDAGPNRPSSFHVVGGQFDTVWGEGAYRLGPRAKDTGAQVLPLMPAEGGFVELTMPQAGHYPFVTHVMADAERGAHGILRVTP